MEPNVDRGMWAIVVLLIAVVIGAATMMIFPDFVDQIGNEMTELMTNPSMIINKGKTGERVVLPTVPDGYVLATDSMFSGDEDGEFVYIGDEPYITIPHIIKGVPVTSYANMFAGNGVIRGVASNNTNVTVMRYMFVGSSPTELDLSNFDTSSVTDMNSMFLYINAVTELDLSSLDTSNVADMESMFNGSSATTLDLSSFDTSNVTDMESMFNGSSTTTLDLSSFDTSKVTTMRWMFDGSSATTLGLSSFDTSNVTNMFGMFEGSSATSLDLSSFDTGRVTDMREMFYESSATTLDLSSFDTSNITSTHLMFEGSSATTGYARTQADADRFNASSTKPAGLTFTVK